MRQTYRGLDKLQPSFREKVELFMADIKKNHGDTIFITETWRSSERQKFLRSTGASRAVRSKHQDGLAVDIAFKDDLRTVQVERELYNVDKEKRREIADVAKKYGLDWGYYLWSWDKPHFQDNGKPLDKKNNPLKGKRYRVLKRVCQKFLPKIVSSDVKILLNKIIDRIDGKSVGI